MGSLIGFVKKATEVQVGARKGAYLISIDENEGLYIERGADSDLWLALIEETPSSERFVQIEYSEIERTVNDMLFASLDTVREMQDSDNVVKVWFCGRPSAAFIKRNQVLNVKALKNSLNTNEPLLVIIDPIEKQILGTAEKKSLENQEEELLKAMGTEKDEALDKSVKKEEAKRLFDLLAKRSEIPFDYPQDCCYSRAHWMCKLLADEGVLAEKAWNYGDLCVPTPHDPDGKVEWWYHVAPIIRIEEAGKEKEYVLDPSMFNEIVLLEKWRKAQNDKNSVIERTNRHVYVRRKGDRLVSVDPNFKQTKRTLKKHTSDRNRLKKKQKREWKTSDCN